MPGEAVLGFNVPDVQATVRAVRESGGTIDTPIEQMPDIGFAVAFVKDPEGAPDRGNPEPADHGRRWCMISLADTTAIVSGGASGIGAAIARGLAGLGAHVVIGDVRVDEGRAVARELGGTFVVCDVSIPEQVTELVDTAVTCGPLRRVVASAGIGHTERTLAGTPGEQRIHDPDAFERVLRINLFGSFDLVRRAAAAMVGRIRTQRTSAAPFSWSRASRRSTGRQVRSPTRPQKRHWRA